jgi:hypothetical protein
MLSIGADDQLKLQEATLTQLKQHHAEHAGEPQAANFISDSMLLIQEMTDSIRTHVLPRKNTPPPSRSGASTRNESTVLHDRTLCIASLHIRGKALSSLSELVKNTLESPLFKTLPLPVRSRIFDGFYHQWTFLFYQAKCKSVPIRSISPFSRLHVNEEHEALTAKRVEAHTKLKQYLDLRSATLAHGQGSNDLASDPIWLDLWGMYARL